MAITDADIKLFQAQDNSDNDSGGGSRISSEVVDGAVNNLFPDISRIDTVSGDVALRKVFPVVTTNNRDIYYGAHAMLRKTPTDPKVSGLIFYTNSETDKRLEAQQKIEAYVVESYKETFWLFGNHIEGAKAVTWLTRENGLAPDVGEVYLLKEGVKEEYIRVIAVEETIITLTHDTKDYQRKRIIATIDQPLSQSFTGSVFHPDGQRLNTADTLATQVADAAKYYGTKSLAEDALLGDSLIKVDSIYEQLVPATKKQTPLINREALSQTGILVAGSGSEVNLPNELSNAQRTAPTPITPKSLYNLTYYRDDGNGNLLKPDGTNAGTVDYKAGTYTQTAVSTNVGSPKYIPATVVESQVQFSDAVRITQENQGLVFIRNLSPLPTVPDFYIDYRSQGKWYRITANQDGTLGTDAAIGAGLLNDNGDGTGTISITLGSLPDLDSTVIFSWGSDKMLSDYKDETSRDFIYEVTLPDQNIKLSTFSMVYRSVNGSVNTLTADSNGNLVHSAGTNLTGYVDPVAGKVYLTRMSSSQFVPSPTTSNTVITYDSADTPTSGDGSLVTLMNVVHPVHPDQPAGYTWYKFNVGQTVAQFTEITLNLRYYNTDSNPWGSTDVDVTLIRLPSGKLVIKGLDIYLGSQLIIKMGDVGQTYPNGDIEIKIPKVKQAVYTSVFGNPQLYKYIDTEKDLFVLNSVKTVSFRPTAIPDVSYTPTTGFTGEISTISEITFTIAPQVEGEIFFKLTIDDASTYSNFYTKSGVIFNLINVQCGTFDNSTGIAKLIHNTANYKSSYLRVTQAFVNATQGANFVKYTAFRTSATKLTTSSFQLRYTTRNGTHNATADGNGVITGTDIDSLQSYVDTLTGAVEIVFTAEANPATFKYDAVSETSLPLDPQLLGLNPVRLPSDGRVPVFTAGRHIVVFNEVVTDIGTPVAGQSVVLARGNQAYIEVVDVNGNRLRRAEFTLDRELGTVNFNNPLVLQDKYNNPLTAPFSVIDRVEDMLLVTDAQINGLLSLSAPLSRNYPVNGTKVASALVWGDIGSRAYGLFSQAYFDSWFDELTQNSTTAQYDDINYPIQINNNSSTSGRWAIIFKTNQTVDVVHEKRGVLLTSVNITTTDIAPLNPATNLPYFTMLKDGFGAGWVTSNVIRFNTDSGGENMWILRTVQAGTLTELQDSIELEIRGDAN